ncbi:MAG: PQQ-dependent sugar dehydrogenase [Ginsengibacter sp.]
MNIAKSLPATCFLFLIAFISCNNANTPSVATTNPSDSSIHKNDPSDPLFTKYKLDKIKLPAGFKIEVYAEIENARSMTVSPDGTVFVGTNKENVYAIPDKNHDGKADKVVQIASGMNAPNGVAFKDGSLFIGTISTIYRLDNIEQNLSNPGTPKMVYDKYPTDKHHGFKFIAFGPDGKLYVPVGAPCNICEPTKPIYASMTRINADGTGFEIYAKGIRNTVGFDWNPKNKDLWFTDNGRDLLGDDQPNDELNIAPTSGLNFGYPYCHQGNILDPEFGKGKNCADYVAPVELLGPHTASLGMRFNKENQFPAEYSNAVFIAQHGSWNRSIPIGYRIAVIKMDENGKPKGMEVFADGWLQNVRDVSGRPVDVQFLKDGSMLVSDDFAGVIYRISYQK